jgi:peroxiredoxin
VTLRLSTPAAVAIVALAAGTAWITWRAKTLETGQDATGTQVALVGRRAPDFRLPSLGGGTVALADFLGKKKLVVIFWATWNNGSHPALAALSVLYKNSHKPESGFEIAAISVDDDRADVQKFVTESRIPFPVLLASQAFAKRPFDIRRVPTVMLIDTSGKVEFGLAGFTPRMMAELAQRLGINDYRMEFGAPRARD